jgi:hypothetical protein
MIDTFVSKALNDIVGDVIVGIAAGLSFLAMS